jgi:hypothetical protein
VRASGPGSGEGQVMRFGADAPNKLQRCQNDIYGISGYQDIYGDIS